MAAAVISNNLHGVRVFHLNAVIGLSIDLLFHLNSNMTFPVL